MKVIIDGLFDIISLEQRNEIVTEYIKQYSETVEYDKGSIFLQNKTQIIKPTDKYPVKITIGNSRYHVTCKKNKKSYSFNVWLSS